MSCAPFFFDSLPLRDFDICALIVAIADQTKRLLASGARMRRDVFGVNAEGEAQKGFMCDEAGTIDDGALPFACYFSPVRAQEQLDDALMKDTHDTILRVDKSEDNFKPIIGRCVRLINAKNVSSGIFERDLVLRLSEGGYAGLNPEYVFGCKNVF